MSASGFGDSMLNSKGNLSVAAFHDPTDGIGDGERDPAASQGIVNGFSRSPAAVIATSNRGCNRFLDEVMRLPAGWLAGFCNAAITATVTLRVVAWPPKSGQ
jgi:hypothetical protein